jgi:hypothetical protein
MALGDGWQRQLAELFGRRVSLEAMEAGTNEERMVTSTGRLLFKR